MYDLQHDAHGSVRMQQMHSPAVYRMWRCLMLQCLLGLVLLYLGLGTEMTKTTSRRRCCSRTALSMICIQSICHRERMLTELLVSQRDDFGEVGAREVPSFFFNFKKAGSGEGEVCLGSWFLFPWQFPDAGFQWDGSALRGSLALSCLGSCRWGLPQPLLASYPSHYYHNTCQFLWNCIPAVSSYQTPGITQRCSCC